MNIFQSIGNWLLEHWKTILLTLTMTDVAAIGTAIFTFVKGRKTSKQNFEATTSLQNSLQDVNDTKQAVLANSEAVKSMTVEINTLKEDNKLLKQQNETLLIQSSAMLDVMSMVYSTLKDEKLRNNVHNVINTAKYAEDSKITALTEELNSLKRKIAEDADKLKQDVSEKATDVQNTLSSAVSKPVNTRY